MSTASSTRTSFVSRLEQAVDQMARAGTSPAAITDLLRWRSEESKHEEQSEQWDNEEQDEGGDEDGVLIDNSPEQAVTAPSEKRTFKETVKKVMAKKAMAEVAENGGGQVWVPTTSDESGYIKMIMEGSMGCTRGWRPSQDQVDDTDAAERVQARIKELSRMSISTGNQQRDREIEFHNETYRMAAALRNTLQ